MRSGKTTWVTFLLIVTAFFAQAADSKELVFLSWPDYMDPELLIEFKQRTGITVKQSYFDSDTARGELLLNSIEPRELKEAEALLQAQAPAVATYRYISLNEDSALLSGQIAMSMMYNGDTRILQEYSDNIVFVLPEEGGNIWTDYLSVLSASSNKADAKRFINFLNEPEIAAQLAQYVHYATPNQAAEALLPASFKEDPVIYPSAEALEHSEAYQRLPPRAQKNRAAIFSRIVY